MTHRHGPWDGVCEYPFPRRTAKPRSGGLTMIIDKGLGPHQTEDLLKVASEYVDYLKFSFGTSLREITVWIAARAEPSWR